jgi:hypothetical protein
MARLFESDEPVTLTRSEVFRVLAALMDALELIDRQNPAFEASAGPAPRERHNSRDGMGAASHGSLAVCPRRAGPACHAPSGYRTMTVRHTRCSIVMAH